MSVPRRYAGTRTSIPSKAGIAALPLVGGTSGRACYPISAANGLPPSRWDGCLPHSGFELFLQDPFFEILFRIEQQGQDRAAVLADLDTGHVAHLGVVGNGADRPFLRL